MIIIQLLLSILTIINYNTTISISCTINYLGGGGVEEDEPTGFIQLEIHPMMSHDIVLVLHSQTLFLFFFKRARRSALSASIVMAACSMFLDQARRRR